jgi:adenylate kinase
MKLLLLGPPASGKGTQASKIAEYLGIPHISTGDIFRENISMKTELGKIVKSYLDNGELVPDEIVTRVVVDKLDKGDYRKGFILDGFPRTIPQAKSFQRNYEFDQVIYIEVDDETVMKRISGRRVCPNCGAVYNVYFNPPRYKGRCDICSQQLITRKDDNPEAAKKRLREYKEKTEPLVEFYDKQNLLRRVNGLKPPEEVFDDIISIINPTTH